MRGVTGLHGPRRLRTRLFIGIAATVAVSTVVMLAVGSALTRRSLDNDARRALSRHIKRGGRIWIRVFPDKPISTKPAEVRMGNGKGNPEYFVCEIQPGKIIYEMDGVDATIAREAFALASAKLPFKTIVVHRMLG